MMVDYNIGGLMKKQKTSDAVIRVIASREKLEEEIGSAFSINMSDDVKTRLRELCVLYGHQDMLDRISGTGRRFSEVLATLIDAHYIVYVFNPRTDPAKELIRVFKHVHRLKMRGKDNETIRETMIDRGFDRPGAIADVLTDQKMAPKAWTEKDVEKMLNPARVLRLLVKIENKQNE
ncbi:hypothetical protein ATP99_04865 [Salmonella enterica]|uniref:Uncharacterized protein n=1 Tax=Salmonella newport TaxID=108619 RepID=A0A5W1YV70_SALNE|nr:hypothetical protein [Salmonella enterica]EBW3117289.1 hypothetical protein [Salmonella enterica subsp. enterica serovar Newport]EAN0444477.1 hypothetical protein [Salmonella enterica]EAQ6093910.1 hypothetical protein [Salmonella enterica]EAS1788483.1 hypothetical protein [Salmonella enterica]